MKKYQPNYSNTTIYIIVCNDYSVIKDKYVGHTTNFSQRKYQHKFSSINNTNLKLYNFINENGGWLNFSMIELEKYPCNNSTEARARERFWYDKLNANLNSNSPTLNIQKLKENQKLIMKRYFEKNRERQRENAKSYYLRHRERILKAKKEYYKKIKLNLYE